MEKQIVVVRHGEKAGDALTAKGAAQVFAAVENLKKSYDFNGQTIYYSGAHRTKQCALVASATLGSAITLEERREFNFDVPFKAALNSDMKLYNAELARINAAGGTIKQALKISDYARQARARLQAGLIRLAVITQGDGPELVFSHSPYTELAVPDDLTGTFPYVLGEADAVVYTITDGVITNAELIKAPQI